MDHYSQENYGLRCLPILSFTSVLQPLLHSSSTVKRLRRKWGLKSTQQQNHTFESIKDAVGEIRGRFPTRGSENIRKNLRQEYGMRVSRQAHTSFRVLVTFQLTRRTGQRKLISDYLKATEPDAVASRRHRRFLRKRFYSAGVNDIWCQDQHDKWLRFGLFFHNNIDPFMMYNNWLKVWWTVKNPRLIASYYFETVRKLGGE